MPSSVESTPTRTVAGQSKAIPFIMLTNDLGAPYRLSGDGPTTELINVQLKRIILPLHAGDASLYLRNHIQGLLGLPGCETTMLGRTRRAPLPLDALPPTGAVVVVKGRPCGLHALRGGVRCQWGYHARTTASAVFRRYLESHARLLRGDDLWGMGPEPPYTPEPEPTPEAEGETDTRCSSRTSSPAFSASSSVATEDLREAEESEALYGQTLNYVANYVPVSCPPPPPSVLAATLMRDCAPRDDGVPRMDTFDNSQTDEDMFTCCASNSCANMPIFTLPLTGFALVAVSTHMVRRACLDPNAAEEQLDKICDEFLCNRKDVSEMTSAQQRRIYEDGMKLMVAASFLQL
ncbi:unnamed protein product [Phytomonas sp. Hart1]|nr:unnamed protein product [Phytomonas sp. Hart1]|eukprot:CCW67537.1 unnamed protein product [Phytomonas sp. isolate Hart1]